MLFGYCSACLSIRTECTSPRGPPIGLCACGRWPTATRCAFWSATAAPFSAWRSVRAANIWLLAAKTGASKCGTCPLRRSFTTCVATATSCTASSGCLTPCSHPTPPMAVSASGTRDSNNLRQTRPVCQHPAKSLSAIQFQTSGKRPILAPLVDPVLSVLQPPQIRSNYLSTTKQ